MTQEELIRGIVEMNGEWSGRIFLAGLLGVVSIATGLVGLIVGKLVKLSLCGVGWTARQAWRLASSPFRVSELCRNLCAALRADGEPLGTDFTKVGFARCDGKPLALVDLSTAEVISHGEKIQDCLSPDEHHKVVILAKRIVRESRARHQQRRADAHAAAFLKPKTEVKSL